ncbi:alpha/beta fold hydrolase [Thermophagus xiamenensis]|uniref:Pimeloyl-ACP methyl ester carboxylesterase n=1 Tax=Thermophagus xiamenensis TaxID=385682 RepID=A0A1I1XRE2_9BACT|nr:alpha/beta fold hydrolase [Thermophagus xiamenensis]SFE09922.1 Pimeloyl-ACP methyl ester carboxylesterase [Thermophagus xiamenensis]
MELFFREKGQGEKNIIVVHGLYGSSDNWLSIAKSFESKYRIILVDQRNHGRSPHSPEHTYDAMSKDLYELFTKLNLKKAILLGHSMGGKTVMRFCLDYPEMIEKLVVLDIAPKSYRSFSNYAEVTADHQKIVKELMSLNPSQYKDRREIDQVLKKSFPSIALRAFLMKNLKRDDNGQFFWQLNLEALKNNMNEIMDGFSQLTPTNKKMPETIFIRGEKSPYIHDEDILVINKFFPGSQVVTIPEAGHWVHAEKPELFTKTVQYFIDD